MRGRSRNKGPNPLTRSYESNGPDVKIRGTAQHVADKYAQLARDAQASGDPVAAENYFQHAEHYYRLIAAAQEQYRQQFGGGFQRDEDGEEGDEDGFGGPPGHGAPGGDEYGDGGFQAGGFDPRGGMDPRGGNDARGNDQRGGQQQRYERTDRPNQNRQRFDRGGERFDRNGQNGAGGYDRGGERYDRQNGGYDRQGGGERYERQNGQNNGYEQQRPDRQQDRRERFARDDRAPREERPREERGPYEGQPPREPRPAREPREGRADRRESRHEEMAGSDEDQGANLPAFLTNPVRAPISVDEVAESAGLVPPAPAADAPAEAAPEATGIRPRRRRTRKADAAVETAEQPADGA